MQTWFVYLYNILFIILYLWVINVCGYAYKSTTNVIFHYLQQLYIILVIDSTFSFSFDLLKITSHIMVYHQAYYIIRMLIFLIAGQLYIKMMTHILGINYKLLLYVPLIIVICLNFYCIFYAHLNGIVWQRTLQDAGILCLCLFYGLIRMKNKANYPNVSVYDKGIILTACFMIAACLEDILYLKLVNSKFTLAIILVKWMQIIGLSDDLFSLVSSILIIIFAYTAEEKANKKQLKILAQHQMDQYQAMLHEKEYANEEAQVVAFCQYYNLTKRESEILRLVLKGRSNQEIADKLFISIGTVKSHIYSIFKKLEIDRRSQLMHIFMNYKEEQ